MSTAAPRFKLRPQERRLIAFVGIVLFVVLNIWLVWPHFDDWGALKMQQMRANRTNAMYRAEIAKVASYHVKLRELEKAGSSVVPEEQELDLVRIVDNQARLNRLTVMSSDPRPRLGSLTNQFFEEQYQTLHVTSGTEELVNFLVSLTSTNSLIRVKDLTIKPDHGAMRLDGQMTLVASYQRNAPVRQASAGGTVPTTPPGPIAPAPAPARPEATNRSASIAAPPASTNKVIPRRTLPSPKPRPTNQPAKSF